MTPVDVIPVLHGHGHHGGHHGGHGLHFGGHHGAHVEGADNAVEALAEVSEKQE